MAVVHSASSTIDAHTRGVGQGNKRLPEPSSWFLKSVTFFTWRASFYLRIHLAASKQEEEETGVNKKEDLPSTVTYFRLEQNTRR